MAVGSWQTMTDLPRHSASILRPADKTILVLSGLSGAGKTTAARALEDLGFFVVDNLPPDLMEPLIALGAQAAGRDRFAFVIDAREARFLDGFPDTWERLRQAGHRLLLVFLDCADDVLVRRFQETRRRHPLQSDQGSVTEAIQLERSLLRELSARADVMLDTRTFNAHQLKSLIEERFGDTRAAFALNLMSFGFKHGLPTELDLCLDVRFLQNPFFVADLRPLTGKDPRVSAYVLDQPDAQSFLDRALPMLTFLAPRFARAGKPFATVAIGCTGGKHRSVATVERLAQLLPAALAAEPDAAPVNVRVRHRDVERE
jgi:RNase adapter protein RapZ